MTGTSTGLCANKPFLNISLLELVEGIGKRLKEVQEDHARRKRDANERNGLEVGDMDDHV